MRKCSYNAKSYHRLYHYRTGLNQAKEGENQNRYVGDDEGYESGKTRRNIKAANDMTS